MTAEKNTKAFYNTEILSRWEVSLLDDLTQRGSGHTPDKKFDEYYNGGIKWVSLADSYRLDNGLIDDTDFEISELGVKKSSAVIHPAGTVLMSRDAGVGKSAIMALNMAVSQHFIVWRCKKNMLDNWYLYYWLQHKKEYFERQAVGSTIKTIGLPLFKKLKISHPCYSEQKAIAHLLSKADAAIHTTEKLITQKELRKKWLMQQLLTGKKRLKGFGGDWKEVKLGKIIEICSSKRVLEDDWKTEGVPFYRTREIIKLSNDEELKSPIFITESLFEELKSKYGVPKPNDILVTGVGTIGETYIVKTEDRFYFKDGNVIWFKMNEKINSSFLSQLFKTVFVRKQLLDNASITTVATFTIEGAKNTKIKLPSIEEQTAIAQVLQAADKEISLINAKAEKLREQKKGLMQVLLTGKVRLKIKE